MKTFLVLSTTLFLVSFISYAQEETQFGFEKGDFILSGTASYSNQNSDSEFIRVNDDNFITDSESNNFEITPEVGYFLSNHFMVGARIGYIKGKSKSQNSSFQFSDENFGYVMGLVGRYYINPKSRVSIFTELEGSFTKVDIESENNNLGTPPSRNEGEQENLSLAFTPGINIFLNKNLSLTSRIGRIGYGKSKSTSVNLETNDVSRAESNNFFTSVSLDNFFFGVLYRI